MPSHFDALTVHSGSQRRGSQGLNATLRVKFCSKRGPGDFVTKVKQINSQYDLIWMSSFAGPSYIIIRSSVYIILIWDPHISYLYHLRPTNLMQLHKSET